MYVRVSAPGKTILMGEHAAVYGRPALVAAVDRRLAVEIAPGRVRGVRLELPQIGVEETVGWPEIRRDCRKARELWRAYDRHPDPESFRRLRRSAARDPAHLVKLALGEATAYLRDPGLDVALRLESRIPVGAGFGSSAALAVAVICAYLAVRECHPPPEVIQRLALEVERRQHGRPSGIDSATVIFGGLLWAERGRRRDAAPRRFARWIARMEATTRGFRAVLAAAPPAPPDPKLEPAAAAATRAARERQARRAADRIVVLVRDFEAGLEALGVVPREVREIVRRVEARGGAAKISGAGSLTGPGAGSLLVFHPFPEEIERWEFLRPLTPLDLWLGAPGVRLEGVRPGR